MPRAAEEVDVVPAQSGPALFLGAVTDTEVHLAVLAFRHGHAHRDIRRQCRLLTRLDVHKFEQFQPIQLPLALTHLPAGEHIPRRKRELAPDNVLADADMAVDFDRAEM